MFKTRKFHISCFACGSAFHSYDNFSREGKVHNIFPKEELESTSPKSWIPFIMLKSENLLSVRRTLTWKGLGRQRMPSDKFSWDWLQLQLSPKVFPFWQEFHSETTHSHILATTITRSILNPYILDIASSK